MRLLLWVLLVVLIALQVNASSPEHLKVTKALESGSVLSAQNDAQDERYLRRADDKIATAEEERIVIEDFETLLRKQDYITIFRNLLKGKHIPSFKYLPFGEKIEPWLFLRALRKAFPEVKVDVMKWNSTPYYKHFVENDVTVTQVRERIGSGKAVDKFAQLYAMWIKHNHDIDNIKESKLIS
ncbi:unnamed protein product [Peronospora destructor]|uniref:RxLR effector protein n=1 Tax=Peronospora destructor TaxID=86335 RepID=A0AAV0T9U3_9STRA|nr:unnamed protein product [Peronospora destructor]